MVWIIFYFFAWSASAATVQTATPDNLNRLTKVDYGNGLSIAYTYDANGNRLTRTVTNTTVAPSIGIQPIAQTASPGQSVTFNVVAAGNPVPTYQWKKNGVAITGATNASYTINTVAASDAGQYTVVITNSLSSVTSTAVTLTVQLPPIPVINSPVIAGAAAYEPFTYAVTATNTPTLYSASSLPPGITIDSATGLISGITISSGNYSVTLSATNAGGTGNITLALTVLPVTTVVTMVGGLGIGGSTNAVGTQARFDTPYAIASDASSNLYVADTANSTIRKIDPTDMVSTFAGSAGMSGSDNGAATAARFYYPFGVCVDSIGNVYVADTNNYTIRKITGSGVVSTFAGTVGVSGWIDGEGSAARFNSPTSLVCDDANNIFVSDSGNHIIRKITPAGVVSTIVGVAGVPGFVDGSSSSARLNNPAGLALDKHGDLYVAEMSNNIVRKITVSSSSIDVVTIAGKAGYIGSADGIGSAARFNSPYGLAFGADGLLYVSDGRNHTLRAINLTNGLVFTVAGNVPYPGAIDGKGATALFNYPAGMTTDRDGIVYLADSENHVIRSITNAPGFTSQPQGLTVATGSSATFTVTATGSPTPTFQWYKNNVAISGATTASYRITAAQVSDSATYKATATNVVGSATSDSVTLTVTTPSSSSGSSGGNGSGASGTEKGGGGGFPGIGYFASLLALCFIRSLRRRGRLSP